MDASDWYIPIEAQFYHENGVVFATCDELGAFIDIVVHTHCTHKGEVFSNGKFEVSPPIWSKMVETGNVNDGEYVHSFQLTTCVTYDVGDRFSCEWARKSLANPVKHLSNQVCFVPSTKTNEEWMSLL